MSVSLSRWPGGHRRETFQRIDSTHAEALRRAAAGESGPLWLLALEQTAGRGRRGREWVTGRGNFAASLLMTPPGGFEQAALRSFVAALALRDALVELTGRPELFSLKWPNDVLLSGQKVAGILLATAGRPVRLAIGFGVNLSEAPGRHSLEETAMTPASLNAATGKRIAPDGLLEALAPAFDAWEARLTAEGFAPVREEWLASAAGLGGPLIARMPAQTVRGRFENIDPFGALILQTRAGAVRVTAADVFLGDPADPPPAPDPDVPPGDPSAPDQPDVPNDPGIPEGPDLPPEEPPVSDPPAPDRPPETPPVYDPPGTDIPTEVPSIPPSEMPPMGPPEIPQQLLAEERVPRAAGD